MAGAQIRLRDTESSSSDNSGVNDYEYRLAFEEIREEEIQEDRQDRKRQCKDKIDAFCDVCFNFNNLIALISKNVAFYLCYLCEQYLCDKCFKGHESHKCLNLVSEKSERDGQIDSFCDEMMNESEREEKFERENVSMVDRVNVKHGLDHKDCWITGLCGLNNKMWVVCDYRNYCIKLFNVGSNLLQRCIRLGSKPWDVTEIKVKNEPTEQGPLSTSDTSVMNQGEPNKQCLLAVTLPWKRRILIIDVTQNPAVITKTIETKKDCRSIDFSGDNIFTLCGDDVYRRGRLFVSVISTDGVTIKTINTDLHVCSDPYLAVCPGSIYITEPDNNKVLCLNDEGKVVSHKTLEMSWPEGISVDPNTNQVYICDRHHDKLYRLDSNLESLEPLFDFESVNSERPFALCLYRDKLYVGHDGHGSTRPFTNSAMSQLGWVNSAFSTFYNAVIGIFIAHFYVRRNFNICHKKRVKRGNEK